MSAGFSQAQPMGSREAGWSTADEPLKLPELTVKERWERVRWATAQDLDLLLKLSERFVDDQRARQGRLDAKASSLLAAVGLALTVAFTFGGLMIHGSASGTSASGGILLGASLHGFAVGAFALAIVAGLGAAMLAIVALRVMGDSPGFSNSVAFPEFWRDDFQNRKPESDRLLRYKQALTLHLWEIGEDIRVLQDGKAKTIRWGQFAFGGFLLALLGVCIPLVLKVGSG